MGGRRGLGPDASEGQAPEGVARAARTRVPGLRASHVWAALCAVSLRGRGWGKRLGAGQAATPPRLGWGHRGHRLGPALQQVPAPRGSRSPWPRSFLSAGAGPAGGRRPVALRGRAGAGGGGSGLGASASLRAAAAVSPHGPGRAWGPGCAGPGWCGARGFQTRVRRGGPCRLPAPSPPGLGAHTCRTAPFLRDVGGDTVVPTLWWLENLLALRSSIQRGLEFQREEAASLFRHLNYKEKNSS